MGFIIILVIISLMSLHLHRVECVELGVGGDNGWAVPSSKKDQLYNNWASNNRFRVNDTLKFEYKKESVLVVTEEEYEKCRSSHPIFFSNSGDTVFNLDRPGLFYFISGVAGHCQRGLKMVVKVLDPQSPPQEAAPAHHSSSAHKISVTAAPQFVAIAVFVLLSFQLVGSILALV